MRRLVSVLLLVVALTCLLVGAATAALFGPDDRAHTGSLPVRGAASVAVVEPALLPLAGLEVRLTAQQADSRPLFIGAGNVVDVASYTDQVARTRVDEISLRRSLRQPLRLGSDPVAGAETLPAPPDGLDWWLASEVGEGEVALPVELPTARVGIVVAALDDEPLADLEVGASYRFPGAFGTGLGLVGVALGLALFSWLARPPRRPKAPPAPPPPPAAQPPSPPTASQQEPQQEASVWSRPTADRSAPRQPRVRLVGVGLACCLATAGCELPQRVDAQPSKVAASEAEGAEVVERWAVQRAEALRLLDAQPLGAVEQPPTLRIDQGAFEVARRLLDDETAEVSQDLRLTRTRSPRLSSYPLWFVAVVEDVTGDVAKLQVHRRKSAVSDWQLVAQADVLASTTMPALAVDSAGAIRPVQPDDAAGLPAAPQDVAAAYVDLLDNPEAGGSDLVALDSFNQQMRSVVPTQSAVDGVRLEQSWSARPVEWAVRTDDGGALMFATLERTDGYRLKDPKSIRWPAESEQRAFLDDATDKTPTLEYLHQVLVYVPPTGAGQARAIGQYGGVVEGPAGDR
ncbi:hypothetical protein BH20ACT6_BH20ACT6_00210 [soil metagenome]